MKKIEQLKQILTLILKGVSQINFVFVSLVYIPAKTKVQQISESIKDFLNATIYNIMSVAEKEKSGHQTLKLHLISVDSKERMTPAKEWSWN